MSGKRGSRKPSECGNSVACPAEIAHCGTCGSCALFLLCEQRLKALLVYSETRLKRYLASKVYGKAECIAELEYILSGKRVRAGSLGLLYHRIKNIKTAVDGSGKALLLDGNDLFDVIELFGQHGILAEILTRYDGNDVGKECTLDTEQSAVTCGAAEQTA